jgi:hypothetical protein
LELARRLAAPVTGTRVLELAPVRDSAHVPAVRIAMLGVQVTEPETAREALLRFVRADARRLLVTERYRHDGQIHEVPIAVFCPSRAS